MSLSPKNQALLEGVRPNLPIDDLDRYVVEPETLDELLDAAREAGYRLCAEGEVD